MRQNINNNNNNNNNNTHCNYCLVKNTTLNNRSTMSDDSDDTERNRLPLLHIENCDDTTTAVDVSFYQE